MIISSPRFAASTDAYPPRSNARGAYAAFVRDAVARYGDDGRVLGSQNRGLPYRPIKAWQVWNEPNFAPYWNRKPDARSYVRFLKLTHDAIASQDESAKVVLAGLSDTKFNGRPNLVPFLGQVYRAGGARYFDVAALNLYAGMPERRAGPDPHHPQPHEPLRRRPDAAVADRVRLGQRRRVPERPHAVPQRAGLAPAPDLPAADQARGRYRIGMAAWFSWRDRAPLKGEPNWWAINSGLVGRGGGEKPALRAFRSVTGR